MYKFKFADIGEGIHEGKVGEILVKEGQSVKDGENLFVVETDKITTEITSPVNGIIEKILFKVGDTIHVGQELFHINDGSGDSVSEPIKQELKVEPEVKVEDLNKKNTETAQVEKTNDSKSVKTTKNNEEGGASVVGEVKVSNDLLPIYGNKKTTSSKKQDDGILISPLARLIAKENNVNIKLIKGTGTLGRILRLDVEKAMSSPKGSSSSNVIRKRKDEIFEITSMRKAIANTLKKSSDSVSYTNLTAEIDVTNLWEFRNKYKDTYFKNYNIKLNLLPFIVKAIAAAMYDHPLFNAIYDETNNQIIKKGDINIGIAIDTKDGLIVPNIKNADALSIVDIATQISLLAQKARDKKIEMKDIKDGTFSITNYGSLGIKLGTPVIKYPELAIAGIGTLETIVKKIENSFIERQVFNLTVAADHRWIDGGDIARFIKSVKEYLENPLLMWI